MTDLSPPEGIAYEDHLPLVIRDRVESGGPPVELASTQHVLETVNAIEEPVSERREESPWSPELVRLDRRINLLVEMVARLLARDATLPPVISVRLYSNALAWRPEEASFRAEVGTPLTFLLYLPSFPALPIALPAVFGGVLPTDPDWSYARLVGVGEAITEQLDHLIFRRHRRMVAGQRSDNHP